jgi:hypothetical protein
MNSHKDLIASLSTDLQSVKPAQRPDKMALAWLGLCTAYVIGVTSLLGPIRPNALNQLLNEPRFFIETIVGILAILTITLVAFRAAVPGALSRRLTGLAIGLLVLWLSSYVIGLAYPTLEPSMLGKRHYCVFETFIYALPPIFLAFWLIRGLYPLRPVKTALWYSLSAGMIPALYMQIACMYVPSHMLQFHIMPGLLVAVLGAALGLIKRSPQN